MTPRPWKHKLLLADVWNDDDLSLIEKRDVIVARIKKLPMYDDTGDDDSDLWWIVDELSDVTNEEDFDVVWDGFYDWADTERVWVELWS
jgi:hypothetical protein